MSRSILIASILRADGDTGVQTHVRAFLAWAGARSLPVSLSTPFDSPRGLVYPVFALRRLIDPLNKPASVWWYRHWHALFLRLALRRKLSGGEPCTIYAQCPLSAAAALQARCAPTQRVVMVVHFNISQADEWAGKGMIRPGGALYAAIRRLEAETLPKVDGLVFVSGFMRLEIAERIPATAALPYRIVPNFLADPGIRPDEDQLPLRDLICIGTLEPRKNQRYALEIVAAAACIGRALSLTIVGDGPDRAGLESLAAELGITQQVSFAGFVRNAAQLIGTHAACLHVALLENLPLTLIEALARGVPVFAPAVGGVPEVFDDGREGRAIPLGDAETAAARILEWLDDEASMRSAGRLARARFLQRFEAGKVGADLHEFLCEPLSGAVRS
ncbi:glycosyltransferase family 4 protein [Rhodocyclus tenuis]|uniref:Glycosyltransferase involved in cell wall biosynthesis n=1 Tax=Rhodocyclus tenuis TaxID=1066 RepID=A0A840G5L5_RHOTE|nr:glycosyltransferase family 4 protein [Rhodocyclus tenuis]MBB4247206.1 glycosyltransferase involved in cell wall biosynthesis [Rhodocyclus tenuis]